MCALSMMRKRSAIAIKNPAPRARGIRKASTAAVRSSVCLGYGPTAQSLPNYLLPNGGHVIAVRPKFPFPQRPLHCRLTPKYLPRRNTFEYRHYLARRHFRMRRTQYVYMVAIAANPFKLNGPRPVASLGLPRVVALADFRCRPRDDLYPEQSRQASTKYRCSKMRWRRPANCA